MTVPAGKVRVRPNANLPGMRAGRWVDVDVTDARLRRWERAGLISYSGPRGEPPPDELARVCCGG